MILFDLPKLTLIFTDQLKSIGGKYVEGRAHGIGYIAIKSQKQKASAQWSFSVVDL